MSNRLLVIVPIACALAVLAAASLAPDPALQSAVLHRAVEASKVVAAAGAIAAALAFERGDYLRRAWALEALTMILLLRTVLLRDVPPGAVILGVEAEAANQAITLLANATALLGTFTMAQAWQVAGIELPGSPARKALLVVGALLIGLVITGAPLASRMLDWSHGSAVSVVDIASSIADIAGICFLAPVLLTVLAMRGGLLVWPWGLYAASSLCWLLYDAGTLDMQIESMQPAMGRLRVVVSDAFRVLACMLLGAAGLAQRLSLRSVREAVLRG